MIHKIPFIVSAIVAISGCPMQKQKAELNVMCSGGFTAAYQILSSQFMDQNMIELETVYGASIGSVPSSIPERLARREQADVVILANEGMEQLVEDGYVIADSRVELAESIIGMAVREGQPLPDISSVDHLKSVLLKAKSIAYSASTSGTYLSTELFQRLGIEDQIRDKCIRVEGERVGSVVARGEAEIGFQQVSELLPIQGITYVGIIPMEVQYVTTYSAAITVNSENVESARKLISYISSSKAAKVITETGLKPKNH